MSEQVTLGELIKFLENLPQDLIISRGFGSAHAWRGDYYEVCFTPAFDVPVVEMLRTAKAVKEMIFEGWKGGSFTYDDKTTCHKNDEGNCDRDDHITEENLKNWLWDAFKTGKLIPSHSP